MLACANTHPDGRIIKLLVLDDQEWAIQARDLGAHILLMPYGVSELEVEVIVLQEGCHGVVFGGEYQFSGSQLGVPSWTTTVNPEEVLTELQQDD
jgi:hypothetical protein